MDQNFVLVGGIAAPRLRQPPHNSSVPELVTSCLTLLLERYGLSKGHTP